MQNRYSGRDSSTTDRLTKGLGWFSVGLGLAEIVAPRSVANAAGVREDLKNRSLLRLYGLRELAAGIGILTQDRPAGWMWARVGGDVLDLSSLASALTDERTDKKRVAFSIASVVGVTAADLYCAQQLEETPNGQSTTSIVRTIIVDKSAEEAYRFWHDFQNLPRFMTYLESVRQTGDRRTHWVAKGPAGMRIEWDAETVIDEVNRLIAWRSVSNSIFEHSARVQFDSAPGGRGTLARVEISFSSKRGAALLRKMARMELGRRLNSDLRKFKQVLEIGEVTQSDASIHPGMHPAQPDPVHEFSGHYEKGATR
jgi:uncharacterized membrane protein